MGARTRGLANNVLSSGKLDATDAVSGVIPASNIANASLTSATTFGSVSGGVPAVASDPPSPAEGDIWYNSTSGQIKFVAQLGSWSSGGSLNTARQSPFGFGSQTSAICATGYSTTITNAVELYNGTAWTEVNDVNTGGQANGSGIGTSTAGLISARDVAGPPRDTGATESWNGTSWTEVNDLNSIRLSAVQFGVQTAAIAASGTQANNSFASTPNVEQWNGTSWTEVGDINTARAVGMGTGTSSDGFYIGGHNGPATNYSNVESWNGTSWTETTDLLKKRRLGGSSINGTTPSTLVFGGYINQPESLSATSELWDGTSWTEVNDLSTAVNAIGSAGTSVSALSFAGTPQIAQTEEFSYTATTTIVG